MHYHDHNVKRLRRRYNDDLKRDNVKRATFIIFYL